MSLSSSGSGHAGEVKRQKDDSSFGMGRGSSSLTSIPSARRIRCSDPENEHRIHTGRGGVSVHSVRQSTQVRTGRVDSVVWVPRDQLFSVQRVTS